MQSKEKNPTINNVDDILFATFCFLSAKDVKNLVLVCKLWNEVSKNPGLWDLFISQESDARALVIERPIEASSHLFYRLNRQALNETRRRLRICRHRYSELGIKDFSYFLNVLKEDNLIIAYHKNLISTSTMGVFRLQLCLAKQTTALCWHDSILSIFRGCGLKMLEESSIDDSRLYEILNTFLFERESSEPKRIEHLFKQHNLAKLVCAAPENLTLFGEIPLVSLEQVTHENFTVLVDMIRDGNDPAAAIEHLYPQGQSRRMCVIL